jgi:hypothetical protein
MSSELVLREQLLGALRGGHAHMTFDQAVADFPMAHVNTKPTNVPYSFWFLLDHIRIAQWDILDYMRNPNYVWMKWPDDYWPRAGTQADAVAWNKTISDFRADAQALEAIVNDPALDLTAPIPHAPLHTYLREILLVADHNAHHLGEFAGFRQVMGLWPAGH